MRKKNVLSKTLKNIIIFLLIFTIALSGCSKNSEIAVYENDIFKYNDYDNYYVKNEVNSDETSEIILWGNAEDASWTINMIRDEFDADFINSNVTVVDALNNDVTFTLDVDNKTISINEEELIPSMQYMISLPEGVFFEETQYMMARRITFIMNDIEHEDIKYNDNVREVSEENVEVNENSVIFGASSEVKQGEIIIIQTPTEDRPYDSVAYKIDGITKLDDGRIETVTQQVTIEEVFDELDVFGEYEANPDDFIIDEEALDKQLRESGILDWLIPSAHAATLDIDEIEIGFKTKKSKDGGLSIDIEITLPEVVEFKGLKYDLVVILDYEVKTSVKFSVLDKQVYDVYSQVETSSSIDLKIKDSDGKTLEDWTDELYDNNKKYLQELEDRAHDKGKEVLRLGTIPIPIAFPVSIYIDIDAFFDYSLRAEINYGVESTSTITTGVLISKEGVKPYYKKESEGEIGNFALKGQFELKTGLQVKATVSACRILNVGLQLEGGVYLEAEGMISYSRENEWKMTGSIECGKYYQLSFVAELNLMIKKIDYEHEFEPQKNPWLKKETAQQELESDTKTLYVDDNGYIHMPEIKLETYNEFNGEKSTDNVELDYLILSFKNLKYGMEQGTDYIILDGINSVAINPKNIGNLDDVTIKVKLKSNSDVDIKFDLKDLSLDAESISDDSNENQNVIDTNELTLKDLGFDNRGIYTFDDGSMHWSESELLFFLSRGSNKFTIYCTGKSWAILVNNTESGPMYWYNSDTREVINGFGESATQAELNEFKQYSGGDSVGSFVGNLIELCLQQFGMSPDELMELELGY